MEWVKEHSREVKEPNQQLAKWKGRLQIMTTKLRSDGAIAYVMWAPSQPGSKEKMEETFAQLLEMPSPYPPVSPEQFEKSCEPPLSFAEMIHEGVEYKEAGMEWTREKQFDCEVIEGEALVKKRVTCRQRSDGVMFYVVKRRCDDPKEQELRDRSANETWALLINEKTNIPACTEEEFDSSVEENRKAHGGTYVQAA